MVVDTIAPRDRAEATDFGTNRKPKKRAQTPRCLVRTIDLAQKDQRVPDALHFMGQSRNSYNLYRGFEIVRDDMGKRVHNRVDSKKLNSFKATAQCRALLGDAARHASEKVAAPPNPLVTCSAFPAPSF